MTASGNYHVFKDVQGAEPGPEQSQISVSIRVNGWRASLSCAPCTSSHVCVGHGAVETGPEEGINMLRRLEHLSYGGRLRAAVV